MNTSKAAVVASAALGKLASIIGYTGVVFFGLGMLGRTMSDRQAGISVIVVLFVLGGCSVLLILKGRQIKRRIKRFKRYVALISAYQMTSIEKLAENMLQSVVFVKKDLQTMIDKQFFANAFINQATNEIVIGGMVASPAPAVQQPKVESFTCSSCGAAGVKVQGALGICEYCGVVVK